METRIIIDEPTHDGLYLQNDRINVSIVFENHGDEQILVQYSYELKDLDRGDIIEDLSGWDQSNLEPGTNETYNHVMMYSAGNYRVYAMARIFNSTQDSNDIQEVAFSVATPIEFYSRQTLDETRNLASYTMLGVIISGIIALSAVLGVYLNYRHNETMRVATEKFSQEQLKLMQASNQELKESNMLTRLSLKLDGERLQAAIPEPFVTVVNIHPESVARDVTLRLFPNFRNDGETALRNTRIYYKVMDRFLELKEIVRREEEIKQSVMEVPETIIPHESKNLNDGREGIPFPTTEGPKSVVVWFIYNYMEDYNSETVFDLRYQGKNPVSKSPLRYSRTDIQRERAER